VIPDVGCLECEQCGCAILRLKGSPPFWDVIDTFHASKTVSHLKYLSLRVAFFFLASPQWHNEARRLCSNVIGYPPGLLPESIFGMISHVRMKDFPFFCCDITIKVTMWGSVIWCSECIWMQVIKF